MPTRIALCALAVFGCLTAAASAQPNASAGETLREQIAALELKLRRLDQPESDDRRVTEIGVTRGSGRGDEPLRVVRMYDLSDLFSVAPTYRARYASNLSSAAGLVFPDTAEGPGNFQKPGGFGGVGGALLNVTSESVASVRPVEPVLAQVASPQNEASGARTSLNALIEAIQNTISPAEWDEVGGRGVISPLGSSLLISTSEATHAQIDALLAQFRKRWGSLRTVSVEAWWLWLTEDQLHELLVAPPEPPAPAGAKAFGIVDLDAWQELPAAQREADPPTRPGYHAAVTCYNGQTVSTLSGGQSLVATSFAPEWLGDKEHGAVGYRPELKLLQQGVALQVTPVTTTSGKFVVLDVHSRVNILRDGGAVPADDDAAGQENAVPAANSATALAAQLRRIEERQLLTQRLSTTLRMPVGELMLLGGMSFDDRPTAGQSNLYLFARVAVQELRDDQPASKPAEAENGKEPPADENESQP